MAEEIIINDEYMMGCLSDRLITECGYKKIMPHYEGIEISDDACTSINKGLIRRIEKRITPSLSRLFLIYLNDNDLIDIYLDDEASDELKTYRETFIKNMTDNKASEIKNKVPGLFAVIDSVYEKYVSFVDEMLQRLCTFKEEIGEVIFDGEKYNCITDISIDSGDVHNNGRTTTIITTDIGKIVYKPHDVRIDYESYIYLNKFFGDILRAPKVFSQDGFGYTEFVVNRPADTDEESRRYFYNLGGLSAIILMMGSSDMHHHNVLADGAFPVIIDYEVMMTPGKIQASEGLGNELSHSLYHSSLMPSRKGDEEMSILFAKDKENVASPMVNGEPKNIADYPDEYFRGFADIYHRCMNLRNEIKEYIKQLKDISIRHIYRGTNTYSTLLEKSTQIGWIDDPKLTDELFRQLSLGLERSGVENGERVAHAEVAAILRGDIPYVYTKTDSVDLYMDGEVVFESFFVRSCVDNVCARLDYLSEEDLRFEIDLIKKAMSRIIKHAQNEFVEEAINKDACISNEELLSRSEKLAFEIMDDALISPSGRFCWFGPDYTLLSGMSVLGSGFTNGTLGLAVFLAAICSISDNQELKERSKNIINYVLDGLNTSVNCMMEKDRLYPNEENVSLTNGLSGKIFGCYLISRYLNDEKSFNICKNMVSIIPKLNLNYEKSDIIGGLAGLLKVLCKYDDLYELPGVPEICNELADRIIGKDRIRYKNISVWKTLSVNWAISGAGHGQSGVASSIYLAGKRLNRSDLIAEAMEGFKFEEQIYSKEINAWPDLRSNDSAKDHMSGYCSGASGIGMNALCTNYDGAEIIVKLAIDSLNCEPLIYKDFICCGNSAIADFLLEAGVRNNNDELIKMARGRMAMVIERSDKEGHYNCVNKSLKNVYSSNLFYGTAGIGYEMLRLIDPGKIESLLL